MSDAVRQNLKISREGIILIKSLEGFRPRALKRGNQWMIGYGHTLSAREGASVTEAEAELLLQYDLLPVARAVNEGATATLNQHQFDALVSFAHSVGIDEFKASKVLRHFNGGDSGSAGDALMAWPDKPSPEAPARRRTAERALFNADPARPATLAELMTSPLPPVEDDGTVLPFPAADEHASVAAVDASPEPETAAPFPAALDPEVAAQPDKAASETPAAATPEPEASAAVKTEPMADVGPVLRHETQPRPADTFDWVQSGPFLLIGALGFLCFGTAMGALRLAAMPSARADETATMGWLLAFVGAACVAVAAWNLYRKWGKDG